MTSPLASLALRLRARADREYRRRLRHPRGSFEAGEAIGRAATLRDVAAQLEVMISEEP